MMVRLQSNGLVWNEFVSLAKLGARHGVFTRLGGVSEGVFNSLNLSRSTGDAAEPVQENRARLYRALDVEPTRAVTSWLVHGRHVRVIDAQAMAQAQRDDVHADGMVTQLKGVTLTMRYADCVPVLFCDPVTGSIGIAHAGWQGIEKRVLEAVLAELSASFGSNPSDVRCAIGPCIGPEKFEVGEDVAARIQASVPENIIVRKGNEKPRVNLWKAATAQLHRAGARHIECANECTASNTQLWFSHRAEQARTGRFGVAICW